MEKKDYIDLINLLGVEKVDCLSDDEDVVEGLGLSSLNIINLIILIEDTNSHKTLSHSVCQYL